MTVIKQYLPVLSEQFKIRSYHTDQNKCLKINYLTAFIQEAAWNHANHLDLGWEFLLREGVVWMLARIYFEMEEYPVWRDEITIETWPKGTDGLFYVRDMMIYDIKRTKLGAATTYWLLVDLKSKRPRVPELHTAILTANKDKHAVNKRLTKLRIPSDKEVDTIKARISDIDLNSHVNSNIYLEWIVNNLEDILMHGRTIRSIQINYLSEVKHGEIVKLFRSNTISIQGEVLFEGLKNDKSKVCFQAAVTVG